MDALAVGTDRPSRASESAYSRLERRFRRIARLGEAAAVLNWDRAAMMPKGGAQARAEQMAELAAVRHGLLTAPENEEWLERAVAEPGLAPWQRANVVEMRRLWVHAAALPEDLVTALARAAAACETAWREAKPKADFAAVRTFLGDLLGLVREAAAAKAERLGVNPYDALLDEYEPGARTAAIDVLFARLETALPPMLERVLAAQAERPAPLKPQGPFPAERQRAAAVKLMTTLGFDFEHGRLDSSLHPFCGGTPEDVRITTRYDEADFSSALMGVLHETGHALYERGLPAEWRGLPVGEARGMALHESQSLLIEMQVCRSRPFLAFVAPLLRDAFAVTGPAWDADNLYRLGIRVSRGLIRVDADEVTYPLHVVLRYRLERQMIAGALAPKDLPEAWNDDMQRLIGVVPPSDREGCLQDIHWYDGAFGYFPTYTLGALTAAQLFAAARRAMTDLPERIARGDFAPLLAWLREKVHARACSVPAETILVDATGKPLGTEDFLTHLAARYLA